MANISISDLQDFNSKPSPNSFGTDELGLIEVAVIRAQNARQITGGATVIQNRCISIVGLIYKPPVLS
jgi:hypothetical protein